MCRNNTVCKNDTLYVAIGRSFYIHCEKNYTGLVTNMKYGVWPVKLEWKVVIHINILVLSNSIAASDCHFRRRCKFISQQPYVLLLLPLNLLATLGTVSHHQNWQINWPIFKWPLVSSLSWVAWLCLHLMNYYTIQIYAINLLNLIFKYSQQPFKRPAPPKKKVVRHLFSQ